MVGILENFRQTILSTSGLDNAQTQDRDAQAASTIDNLISLGVLLWEVAQADEKFLPEEEEKIKETLAEYGQISDEDMPVVLRAIKEASIQRIDLYNFTREVGSNLNFKAKIGILENLFRIGCADRDLAHEEHEIIRKISGLLNIDHKDFINTKIRIKKDFGLDTSGF